jgi:hypothetical protein
MALNLSADQFRRAAEIKDKIEALQEELKDILQGRSKAILGTKATRKGRVGRVSPLAGKKRPVSPSGPLAPAVVKILEKAGKPLSVNDIYDLLVKADYSFTTGDPKKNLYARIHALKGVKRVGSGQFALDK